MGADGAANASGGEVRAAKAGETSDFMPAGSAFRLRAATLDDIPELLQVEREAFPTQWPPTRFERELRKPHALCLVAVRPWEPGERAGDGAGLDDGSSPPDADRLLARLGRAARSVSLGAISQAVRSEPPEHVAGFAALWFVADEMHIVTIGTRAAARGHGVGDLLLIGVAEAAVQRGSTHVTLEVRKSNDTARSLYRKHGFREAGIRKRYYSDDREDAVIMTTPPIQSDDFARALEALIRDHAERWGASASDPG